MVSEVEMQLQSRPRKKVYHACDRVSGLCVTLRTITICLACISFWNKNPNSSTNADVLYENW